MHKIFSKISRVAVAVLILFVRFYQILISPLFPDSCRFTPSCSAYSIQALKKYGVFKGLYKSVYRILRCNPFSRGGHDPA